MRNPLAIDKQKVQNLPDPGGSSGGSDVQRETITADIMDTQNDQNPYVPPLPVPLARQVERKEGQRGESSEIWLVNPPTTLPGNGLLVGGGNAEKGSQFPINSIRIDNLTSQWIYFPENGAWVPPFWYGRVFRYDGNRVQRVRFETPTGITALPATSTNIARVVFSEEYWDEQSGSSATTNLAPTSTGAPNAGVTIFDDLSGLPAEVQTSADALANQAGLITDSFGFGFNGVTWDRLRLAKFDASSAGGVGVQAIADHLWNGNNVYLPKLAAAQIVTDTNNGAQIQPVSLELFDGGSYNRARVPKIFKQVTAAINAGSTAVIWTPAAALRPRVMGWVMSAASGLVGDASATFFDTATTGLFMGETGFMSGTEPPYSASYGPGGPIVALASGTVIAFSSVAMTLRGTIYGTEE